MRVGRKTSLVLTLFGVWSWVIYIVLVKNVWVDPRAFHGDAPTAFLYVHVVIALISLGFGSFAGVLGLRGLRAARTAPNGQPAEPSVSSRRMSA